MRTDDKEVKAQTVIVATGAVAKRMEFPGSGEVNGYWNKGISACAVCDGAAPLFRKKPLAVIGGGDSAMEEATFLTKYGSKVRPNTSCHGSSFLDAPLQRYRCGCRRARRPFKTSS